MSSRQQTVRSYEPTTVERFDDQFWPILMSLCITATVLAATIVTLMAGFWMWVSLLVLPAAITMLLVALRFIDNRRLRRSLQLAVILSLAAHCAFVIFAKQTQVFSGFFYQVNRVTTPVQQQRVIHVSRNVENMPWMEENPTPTPDVAEPIPEKTSVVETSTARPQPSPVTSREASENPQLVRRQQLSRTVPRLGKNLSRLSRQTENQQPKSSEQVAMARAAPSNRARPQAELEPSVPEINRRSRATNSRATKASRPAKPAVTSSSEFTLANNRSPSLPTVQPTSEPRLNRRATTTPRAEPTKPQKNVRAPVAAAQPESPRSASTPSDSANLQRRSNNSVNPVAARLERRRAVSSLANQLAQPNPNRRRETPSVTSGPPNPDRARAETRSPRPSSPEIVERPRPASRSNLKSGSAELNPQPMALKRSTGGVAGAGRSVNYDRNTGSRQSSALAASDSVRRKQPSSQQNNPNSLSLKQMSRVPRSAASAEMPSVVNRPDAIPLASRPASDTPAELTASASATLTQADSEARRGETSVAKGSGSVDLGPQKIVSDSAAQRVEGGGQPTVQPRPANPQSTVQGDLGSAAPSLASETIERIATDDALAGRESRAADLPTPSATGDLLTRSGGQSAASGAPLRSEAPSEDRANTTATELAAAALGRAEHNSDTEEEDEEERRRRQRAERLAESSRELTGSDTPTFDAEVESIARPGGSARQAAAAPAMQEVTGQLANRGSRNPAVGGAMRPSTPTATAGSGETAALAQRAGAAEDAPQMADGRAAAATRNTTGAAALAEEDRPQPVGRVASATGLVDQVSDDANSAELSRNSPAGMALNIDAKVGPAGISQQLDADPGIDSRRASRSSPALQSMTETRFRREQTGGAPSISAAPIIAKEAYRTRNQPSRTRSAPKTEESIELGLGFLARQQQEDGSWTLHAIPQDQDSNVVRLASDTAATGLAILAFQGAGYNHKEFKYAGQLQAAVQWLVENQRDTGELYIYTDTASDNVCRFYSHGIATLALAEAYGMTQDEDLRITVQLALDYIAETQHKRLGGWRYRPGVESDTSVTGWMMMALQSGRLADLETDQATWQGIERWLSMARLPNQDHLFRYNPEALDKPETRHGREASPCMTAVGLLMHLYLGWDRSDPRLAQGAKSLLDNLPDDTSISNRDTYYWYYATQIIRHVGGESWQQWHGKLHPLLVGSQIKDGELAGSWDPLNPVPDRWGAQAGRLYVTAMNLLSLEVDYRLLPLHDETVK